MTLTINKIQKNISTDTNPRTSSTWPGVETWLWMRGGGLPCTEWVTYTICRVGSVPKNILKFWTNSFLLALTAWNHPFYPDPIYFVHQCCPAYQAYVMQQWFHDHPQFRLLPWPSKGADCNFIKNVWGSLAHTAAAHESHSWGIGGIPGQAGPCRTPHRKHAPTPVIMNLFLFHLFTSVRFMVGRTSW